MAIIGGGGGGGGSSTLARLFDSTLGADTASIDTGAGGVAAAGSHLLVVLLLRSTQAAVNSNANLVVNNDTGTNYDRVNSTANSAGTSASAAIGESAAVIVCPGASCAAGIFAAATVVVPCFQQTTADKILIPYSGYADTTAANSLVQIRPTTWANTAAVTRIAVSAASGSLKAGSRMTIYSLL